MTNEQRKEIYDRAISHYSRGIQLTKAIEELSELIAEIAKFKGFVPPYNKGGFLVAKDAPIIGEMADVIIMLEQMQTIMGITDEDLNSMIAYKLGRLVGRMEREDSDATD